MYTPPMIEGNFDSIGIAEAALECAMRASVFRICDLRSVPVIHDTRHDNPIRQP